MQPSVLERRLAKFSIAAALLHFAGETYVHLLFGQFLPMLIVDYIAVSLLLYAGFRSLQSGHAPGLLCGAWGFAFCLSYRTLFWRVEVLLQGGGDAPMRIQAWILAGALVISVIAFAVSMYLCHPRRDP